VAGYVAAGVVLSPDLLGGPLGLAVGSWSGALTTAALGMVAYLIGGSMTAAQLGRLGRAMTATALAESLGAAAVVFLAVSALAGPADGLPGVLPALALAAIAATTAPAATLAVLHQYRARGPLTDMLLGVVALDDALGILLFAVVLAAGADASPAGQLGSALVAIGGAVLAGALTGRLLAAAAMRVHQPGLRLPMVLAGVLVVIGLAEALGLSPLLACMTLGFASRHFLGTAGDRLLAPVEFLEEMVFVVFFTVAGAHFQAGVFLGFLDVILIYLVARLAGKLGGAFVGARLGGAPPQVARWIGLGLAPQAGVAVGLALSLGQYPAFQAASLAVVNIVLGTTLLYELLGPLAVRFALARAGELGPERRRMDR
jgi:Kef-type K+ transport system membrane component KefB